MKILFITDFILAVEQGAKQSTKAHYQTLKEIFGEDSVDVVSLNSIYEANDEHIIYYEGKRNKYEKLMSILQGAPFLISKKGENEIIKLCKKNSYSCAFVDHSIYGHIIKRIKKEVGIPVVTYFHGIMQYHNKENKKHNKTSFYSFIPALNMKYNEIDTVKYSDVCLVLNNRDNNNLYKYYNRKTDDYFPVYYTDTANIKEKEGSGVLKLLFVGGYFWPNVRGITWFVENVMPLLPDNIQLDIVGNNMERLTEVLERDRVTVHGRVECLDDFYNDADVVVGPIFEGDGMKTKTCEALMYGKLYLGTDEALEGYEGLDHLRCNTAEEFIEKIKELNNNRGCKYHEEMRNIYLEKYSPQMAKKKLTDIFIRLGVLNNEDSNHNI